MNKNEILLNMRHDTIIFSDQLNISISIFFDFVKYKVLKLIAINFNFFSSSQQDL